MASRTDTGCGQHIGCGTPAVGVAATGTHRSKESEEAMTVTPRWTSESGFIDVNLVHNVAVITLRRPDKLNALTFTMRSELARAVIRFGRGELVQGIVVTGEGRAFSAGEDLHEASLAPVGSIGRALKLFNDLTRAVLSTKVPVVAAVNGIAVGGAAEWTLCFDGRVGSEQCEYYFPEGRLGLPISNASSLLLPRLVGARAIDLLLSGRRIDAQEALRTGLIDEVVDSSDVVDAAVGRVLRWTDGAKLTSVQLDLLRPRMSDVEAAIAREVCAASENRDGLATAGGHLKRDERPGSEVYASSDGQSNTIVTQ